MFFLMRLFGVVPLLLIGGYFYYTNVYNTPEAKFQRGAIAAIDAIQEKVAKHTGIPIIKEESFMDKVSNTITTVFEDNKELINSDQKIPDSVKTMFNDAKKQYNNATSGTTSANVKYYNNRTSNNTSD